VSDQVKRWSNFHRVSASPLGEIHCDDRPESDYDLSLLRLSDGTSIGVDASRMGNEARFVNDYRGVKQKPNAIFADSRSRSGELQICVRSRDEIKKGQEILVSYGKSWWTSRQQAAERNINEA
jgi:SET domain-containing protein